MTASVPSPAPGQRPSRRSVLRGAAALGATALGCQEADALAPEADVPAPEADAVDRDAQAGRRPNVLWIVVDQHRFDVAGYMGDRFAATPSLDELARGAVRFDATYCQVPLCAPARQSLLTGQYAHTHTTFRNNEERFPDDLWTVARAARDGGYRTGLFGKTHCDTSGFERVRELKAMLEDYATEHPGAGRPGVGHYTFDKADEDYDYVGMMNPGFERAGPGPNFFMEEAVAREAGEFALQEDARPFFAWASFVNPHPPLFPPDAFHARFDGVELPLRGRLDEVEEGLLAFHADRRAKHGLGELPKDALLNITRAYYASLAWTDHCVGQLLATLAAAGRLEDTLVVYTSDHGEMLGQHGLLKKWAFYEAAVRVPMLVSLPARFAARRVERAVQHVDLVPTLLELLGLEPGPDPLPGRSLVPLLERGEDPERDDVALAELAGRDELHYMVRSGGHKYVWHGDEDQALFDLAEDPGELRNLAEDPGQADRIAALKASFDEHTAATTWNIRRR